MENKKTTLRFTDSELAELLWNQLILINKNKTKDTKNSFIERVYRELFYGQIWTYGNLSDRKGILGEFCVKLALEILQKEDPSFYSFELTERFSSLDKRGIDINIIYIATKKRMFIPLQVKSSAAGRDVHRDSKKGKEIPSVVSSIFLQLLKNKLKRIISSYTNNEIIHI